MHPILVHRGYHRCDLCTEGVNSLTPLKHNWQRVKLGSTLICVFNSSADAFISPDLIFHYVSHHNYMPPVEYRDAVLNGPQPGTREYAMRVRPYISQETVTSAANDAARALAARYGYYIDANGTARWIPDEAFDAHHSLSLDELAIELRIRSYE